MSYIQVVTIHFISYHPLSRDIFRFQCTSLRIRQVHTFDISPRSQQVLAIKVTDPSIKKIVVPCLYLD